MLITSSTIFLCGSEKMSELTQQAQQRIVLAIGDEIHAQAKQVQAAIGLLDEGATVPFEFYRVLERLSNAPYLYEQLPYGGGWFV